MPCYNPKQGFRYFDDKLGRMTTTVTFSRDVPRDAKEVKLPCGQCLSCLQRRTRDTAVRCMHEASMHEDNCFITLTYADEFLPADGSLHVEHFQDFIEILRDRLFLIKRKEYFDGYRERHDCVVIPRDIRKALIKQARKDTPKIRYYHCGEYGELNKRPHYHALLFGFDFKDKVHYKNSHTGHKLYRSAFLESCWTKGFADIGDVTFESAAYVARYVHKKKFGMEADNHYSTLPHPETGEIYKLKPEYTTRSQGIGRAWYDKFKSDIYPRDEMVLNNGHVVRPPRYYDKRFAIDDPLVMDDILAKREEITQKFADIAPDRLAAMEKCRQRDFDKLIRGFDKEL